MTRQEYVDIIKTAAETAGKKWVMEWLVSKIPFIGFSFPHAIVGWVVGKVLWIAIQKTELGAFFLFVDFRTSAQGRQFLSSAIENRDAQQSNDKEAKKRAEEKVINDARTLIKFAS